MCPNKALKVRTPSKFSLFLCNVQLNIFHIIYIVDDFSSIACVWSVCVARKAPLVASDSSSSNSSDSDEEEGKKESAASQTVTVETVTTGTSKETLRLTVDAKNERAFFSRYSHTSSTAPCVLCVPVVALSFFVFLKTHFPFPLQTFPHTIPTSSSSVFLLLFPSFCLFPPFTFTHAEYSNQQSDGMFCSRSSALLWNVFVQFYEVFFSENLSRSFFVLIACCI